MSHNESSQPITKVHTQSYNNNHIIIVTLMSESNNPT